MYRLILAFGLSLALCTAPRRRPTKRKKRPNRQQRSLPKLRQPYRIPSRRL